MQVGDDLYVLHSSTVCIPDEVKCDDDDDKTFASEIIATKQECDIDFENIDESDIKFGEITVMTSMHPESESLQIENSQIKTEPIEENKCQEREVSLKKLKSPSTSQKRQPRQKKPVSEGPKQCTPKTKSASKKRYEFKYKCKFEGCGEMVKYNSWSYHQAKHRGNTFECDICHAKTATKNSIKMHILRVHDAKSKKFKCDLCGSLFLTATILAWHHKLVHLKERDHMCSECGKTFNSKGLLRVHTYVHTGEKPYQCEFEGCNKWFRSKPQRIEHMRSHTGIKPFKCPAEGCDREFGYNTDFRRHKFTAHGIIAAHTTKFPCQICSAIFPENMLLKQHMKKHKIQP